jgi:hypothetical protein
MEHGRQTADLGRPSALSDHKPHCHGHHDQPAPADQTHDQHAEHHYGDSPCNHDGQSCRHCQSIGLLAKSSSTTTVDLKPTDQGVLAPLALLPAQIVSRLSASRWSAFIGDPSPPLQPTLLRLHCALNS